MTFSTKEKKLIKIGNPRAMPIFDFDVAASEEYIDLCVSLCFAGLVLIDSWTVSNETRFL